MPNSEEDENLSKIERLKKQKSKSKKKQEKLYYRVAFAPYLKEKTFENVWNKALLHYEDKKAEVKTKKNTNKASQSSEFTNYFSANDGMGLGIEKMIVVTPNYTYARTTSKDQVDFASTEKGQAKFNKSLLEVCEINNVEAEILHPTQFDEEDADKFNDMAVLQQYISERFFHGKVDAYVSNSDRVKEIAKKYDTRYILYTGTFSSNSVDANKIISRIQSMIYIITIPYVLYKFLSVPHETLYYSFIFDIETGQMILGDIKISKLKNYDSIVWNNLNQIVQKASTPTDEKIKD